MKRPGKVHESGAVADLDGATIPDMRINDMSGERQHLRKLQAGLRRIIESNLMGTLFTDANGFIIGADDGFLRMVGFTREEFSMKALSLREITPAEFHRADEEAMEKVRAFGACAPFEKEYIRKDGSRIPVIFGATALDLPPQEIICFVLDLTQHKQAQQKLNHLAYHDALTDLPNQVLFRDRLKQAIALSRRNDEMQAVLLLNLDRFKTINDSLGYTAGDSVLQAVAQRLTSCVRETDTVARFGSDEFAILVTQIPRHQDAANVASTLR